MKHLKSGDSWSNKLIICISGILYLIKYSNKFTNCNVDKFYRCSSP